MTNLGKNIYHGIEFKISGEDKGENDLVHYYLIIEKYEETLFDIVIGIHLTEYRCGTRTESQVVWRGNQ